MLLICSRKPHDARDHEKTATTLEDAGIDVRYVTPIMHHKFAIVDGGDAAKAIVLTGSTNWSQMAFTRYDEDLLKFTNEPAIAASFQSEFNHLWSNSREYGKTIHKSGPTVSTERATSVSFTSANLKTYKYRGQPSFRSSVELRDGACGVAIRNAIDSAKSSILIATTHFRREDFYESLVKAKKKGVTIQLLLDQQEYHSSRTKIKNARFDEKLAAAGAAVRYKVYSPYWDYRTALQMHCKYMVVDDKKVLTGSFNWSENAELKTFENLVTITDKQVVVKYQDRFKLKWTYGDGDFDKLVARIAEAKGKGPCNFSPITMSGKRLVELRKKYARGACRNSR